MPQTPAGAAAGHQANGLPRRSARVRPYALTGGRTRFGQVLLVETLVSAVYQPGGFPPAMPELERICELCQGQMRSIAEVSALLRLPLGVVRVWVSDLVDAGRIRVHGGSVAVRSGGGSAVAAPARPNRMVLERILGGLRDLA
ncbi:DUF742 domain-containing protein [Streptacidiphilus sp. PB12-B1b]|uniref:DUF742 domain-containing protein n=1 Tax=Streptacidiphilus sp. PB12-B1b TaxID=2705012 RepID=UPI0015F8BA0F|nr:DUF742 domain-containing protein [Streptacidiphilus sp. PB12-B1b]QMU77632.1 DUF742 domain-containing protein [Streptacidiphilus sp. PB12-B1b]